VNDPRPTVNRNIALLVGCLFIFLLVASAPHRVHHLFDSDESPKSCVVFTLSKGCHLSLTPTATIFVIETFVEKLFLLFELAIPTLVLSPFSQRAPPLT
jgi:hypothetical protein